MPRFVDQRSRFAHTSANTSVLVEWITWNLTYLPAALWLLWLSFRGAIPEAIQDVAKARAKVARRGAIAGSERERGKEGGIDATARTACDEQSLFRNAPGDIQIYSLRFTDACKQGEMALEQCKAEGGKKKKNQKNTR